jgi:hypothetical protein
MPIGKALHRARWKLSREISADVILARAGGRRMSAEEFDRYLGDLPTDGEG